MNEANHMTRFYENARKDLARLYPKKRDDRPDHEWIPAARQAIGVRFGYWRKNEKYTV